MGQRTWSRKRFALDPWTYAAFMPNRPPKSFVVSRAPANLEADRRIDFTVQGFDAVWGRRFTLHPADRVAFYATSPMSGFVATVEIASEVFTDDDPIWPPSRTGDMYSIRYRARPRLVLPEAAAAPGRALVEQLDIARHLRDASRWGMLFRHAVREIPGRDFDLIEFALKRAVEEAA